ncbi:hypothetical protein ACFLXY_00490 [Chloroflexota bacterium]
MNTITRKQSFILNNKGLLLSRVILLIAALGILVISLFTSDPDTFTIGHTFEPLWDQVLITGGIAILIVLYSWWWTGFGSAVAVVYGLIQILGDFRTIQSGHIETTVPVSIYYSLYALLIAGGLIGIIAGLRRKTIPLEDTNLSKRLRKIALIVNLSLAGAATVFGIVVLIISITYYFPDYLIASAFFLFPALLVLAWIAWMWPAQGGLLEIITGVFWLNVVNISSMDPVFSIPYVSFFGLLMAAGCLNIARGYITRTKDFVNEAV